MTKQLVTAETSSKTQVKHLTRSWGWEPPRIVYASRVPPRHFAAKRHRFRGIDRRFHIER